MKWLQLVALLLLPYWASADTITGRVVNVHDGDTITVLDAEKKQHKIRLAGIDAPELGQAYGRASRDTLAEYVAGKAVTVEVGKLDKYGRAVGKVLLDSKDQCLEQLRAGLAWHYKKYEKEQMPEDRRGYSEAEQSAREARRGLWVDSDPLPPWVYRKTKIEPGTTQIGPPK